MANQCIDFSLLLFIAIRIVVVAMINLHTCNSSYNITCDAISEDDCQNNSLETLRQATRNDMGTDVQVNIKIPELTLNTNVSFINLKSLTITGIPGLTVITCTANTGILLKDIDQVILRDLNLSFCGYVALINVPGNGVHYSSALTIVDYEKMEIDRVVIEQSIGVGLLIIAHPGSKVNVTSSIFKGNQLLHTHSSASPSFRVWGGNGVHIRINSSSIQLNESYVQKTMFHFHDCKFENNTANNSHFQYTHTDILGEVNAGYGRGGGVYVLLSSNLTNVSVSFLGCKFITNNAFLGAGLSVKIYGDGTRNVHVEIIDSLFECNGCNKHRAGFGGGAHLTLHTSLHANSGITKSYYFLRNVTFVANCGEIGGGLYHYSNRQNFHNTQDSNSVTCDKCVFKQNKAHMGSAVMMAPDINRRLSGGYTMVIKFLDCQFIDNAVYFNSSVTVDQNQKTAGVGTVYISSYDIIFQGYNRFDNNFGTALYVANAIINFQKSNVRFSNNTGLLGGAVTLIGSSVMILGRKSYDFVYNTAQYKGGAIYVSLIDNLDFIGSKNCFIQYSDDEQGVVLSSNWKANVTFVGNRAKDATAGHAIYATCLHPCQLVDRLNSTNGRYILLNTSEVFSVRGFKFDGDEGTQTATDGAIIQSTESLPLKIIPGQTIKHGVVVTDDLGKYINASFWATITEISSGTRLDSTAYSTLVTDEIRVKGKPSQSLDLDLNILSLRQSYINLKAELLDCPPGFELKDNSECVCNLDGYTGLFKCDYDNFQSFLLPGYWAGYINQSNLSNLATSACPFCDYSATNSSSLVILPRIRSELDKAICGDSRTSVACGRCRDNYIVHFHSPDFLCKSVQFGCKLGWLFYILSELVPVTLVFIIVLSFNVKFTSGAINGFILYSQLLSSIDLTASGIIKLPGTAIRYATQAHQIIYGFFNLDFFNSEPLSFCLWKGASALDMLAIKYITILYTLLLIVTVIWTIKQCGGRWFGRYCRITTIKTSVIHGISSFLMIGYAQCVTVSLKLLFQLHIYTAQSNSVKQTKRVWLNGEIVYFSKQHLPYAIPALICLLTIGLLPPVLLITYPLLNKMLAFLRLEESRLVKVTCGLLPISTLKPLLDSFQGCFKDNFRFFAGLYFLYRWIFLIIHMSNDFSIYYIAVGCALLVMLTLHTVVQPYIMRAYNIVDALLLSNLILINFLSLFGYHKSHSQDSLNSVVSSAVVQLVLIYLPIMVLCVYLLKRGYQRNQNVSKITVVTRVAKLRELIPSTNTPDKSPDSNIEFVHDRLMDDIDDYSEAAKCDVDTPFTLYTK